MGTPLETPSDSYIPGNYLAPIDRYRDAFTDYERGGLAVQDPSLGIDYQHWTLQYISDEDSPNYGDFVLTAETTGTIQVVFNIPNVQEIGLAFDQNMNLFICYQLYSGESKFYWYDTVIEDYKTTQLPDGSRSPRCTHDDHRDIQVDQGETDIILGYIRNGTCYIREQKDRYGKEITWVPNVGAANLYRIGMTDENRVEFEIRRGRGVRLSEIVGDILTMVGFSPVDFDVSELHPILVRGFMCAGTYSAADAIRSLQRIYFFDMPEVDGKLVAVLRGADVVATIYNEDTILGTDIDIETAREQGVEFAAKMHVSYQCAEYDYTTSKETSERLSPDIKNVTELTIENPVNMLPDETAETAVKLHKVAWSEQEGKTKRTLPEKYIYLIPSSTVQMEIGTGEFKRMRLERYSFVDGSLELDAVIDRASAYEVGTVVAADGQAPTAPPTRLPGDTTWQFMDLPILDGTTDELIYYVAAYGNSTAYRGAQLQREIGSDWEPEAEITISETMGQLEAAFAAAPAAYIDTTNTILVSLNDAPESVSIERILKGGGAWLVGDEIIQVRDWVADGNNRRGSYITRGRLNTTAEAHTIGERVVLLGNPIAVPSAPELIDSDFNLRAVSYGQLPADAATFVHTFEGKSAEEWAPIDLVANQSGSDWVLSWVPRYRLGSSANPIPSIHFYGWVLRFTAGGDTHARIIETTTPEFTYTAAMQTEDFGSTQSSFTDVEIRALSRIGGEGQALNEAVS